MRSFRWLTAAAVLVVGVVGLADASAAPTPSATVTPRSAPRLIDRSDKAAVRAAYLDTFVPAINTATGWTGSVEGCQAGSESGASRRATLRATNYVRDMAGIGPVTIVDAWNRKAQQAALMMDAANGLSHSPAPGWPCYTAAGAEAAGRSNLYWTTDRAGAYSVIEYIVDRGDNNTRVGHRRWILNPEVARMGTGSTAQANAMWVIPGSLSDPVSTGPDFIAWPPSGYVPMPLVIGPGANGPQADLARWSLSTKSSVGADFSRATVTATLANGTSLPVTVVAREPNGSKLGAAIVWTFRKPTGTFSLRDATTVRIKVTGIRVGGRTVSKSYTVKMFPLFPPTTPTWTISSPGPRQLSVTWDAATPRGSAVTGYTIRLYTQDTSGAFLGPEVASMKVGADVRTATMTVPSAGVFFPIVFARSAAGTSARPTTNIQGLSFP